MTEYVWSYRSTAGPQAGIDLTGFKVDATDGGIGKVAAHSNEVTDAYLVVDTGTWIFGKEVLLPANTVVSIDPEERRIHVDQTRGQIKDAPEFDREKHLEDPEYRALLGSHYGLGGTFGRF